MRGGPWVTFDTDLYLDARSPEWAEYERLGYVRAFGQVHVLCVHYGHASRIVEVLRRTVSARAVADDRKSIVKVPRSADAVKSMESHSSHDTPKGDTK